MNNQFDQLAKGMAQSVTRRAALKKFGVGLAGMALACFGLANRAEAAKCNPAGVQCYSGFASGNPSWDCRKCCNGYTCTIRSWGLGKVCYCQ